jgi:hypothetical protein
MKEVLYPMTRVYFADRLFLATLSVALIIISITGCASSGGIKATDPHLVGQRDMNYDHLIVPGVRIGPVRLGGSVSDAVQHLGEPDRVFRSTFRGPGYDADEVYYYYNDECIQFTWQDSGVEPLIENGWRGIIVTCAKWTTADGVHAGMPIKEAITHLGQYCPSNRSNGSLLVVTKEGIWFDAANRNSPVSRIIVVPARTDWGGMCKD